MLLDSLLAELNATAKTHREGQLIRALVQPVSGHVELRRRLLRVEQPVVLLVLGPWVLVVRGQNRSQLRLEHYRRQGWPWR